METSRILTSSRLVGWRGQLQCLLREETEMGFVKLNNPCESRGNESGEATEVPRISILLLAADIADVTKPTHR